MTQRSRSAAAMVSAILSLCALVPTRGEDWVLPPNAGIVNVVTDFGVDNTGRTDVSAKLTSIIATTDRKMVYLPKGTYLVSQTIQGPNCNAAGSSGGPFIVGESRAGTVIRLADNTWPVDSLYIEGYPSYITKQVVLHGGDCSNNTFGKEMRNFTIDIGSNNDGATAINFSTANYGCVTDIDIVSRDGKGCVGLSLTGGEIGPALVRNVRVSGFKTGIYASAPDDITLSQIVLEQQTKYGVLNAWTLSIDSLKCTTTAPNVPAIYSRPQGRMVVLNGFFAGNSASAAIINIAQARLFLRNIRTSGYQKALASYTPTPVPSGAHIDEYASHASAGMWYTPGRSLNLPVSYPVYPAWEQDLSRWNDIQRYRDAGQNAQTAVRSAFSTPGKTSVFVNSGGFTTTDTVFVEGAIQRVMGGAGTLYCPAVVIRNNTPPVVVIQDLEINPWSSPPPTLINRSSKTVILDAICWGFVIADGTGDLFINQLMGRVVVKNPKQRVWIRSFNAENAHEKPADTSLVLVASGQAWLLGYKTEGGNVKGQCTGGLLEMFDILNYNVCSDVNRPLFRVSGDGQFSMALLTQISHSGTPCSRMVSETRNGETRYFTSAISSEGFNATLYTGYPGTGIATPPTAHAPVAPAGACALRDSRLLVTLPVDRRSLVEVRVTDMRGRSKTLLRRGPTVSGSGTLNIDVSRMAPGLYGVTVVSAGKPQSRQIVLVK